MEPKSYAIAPRADVSGNERIRGLRLIKPREPQCSQRKTRARVPVFSPAEMRHSFAIWSLDKEAASGRRLHLYYCLRCKWSFSVDDRRGSVAPLDLNGNPIQGAEAAERLATFGLGPCPVFNHLGQRLTQEITLVETLRTRVAALILPISAAIERLISCGAVHALACAPRPKNGCPAGPQIPASE